MAQIKLNSVKNLSTLKIYLSKFLFIFICLFFLLTPFAFAKQLPTVSWIGMQNMNVQDAIKALAAYLKIHVVISPEVRGIVQMNFSNMSAQGAWRLLLASHHLTVWQEGDVYFISPEEEAAQRETKKMQWEAQHIMNTQLKTIIVPIQYAKAADIAKILKQEGASLLSSRGVVSVDDRANILCILEIGERIELIRKIIKRLDIAVPQVLIEARIASLDHDYERELGLAFMTASAISAAGQQISGNSSTGRYNLATVVLANSERLDVKLSALEKAGHAELISNPSLFAANQQTAVIEAGEEIPYQEVSESGGTAVVFKKAVLRLKVTPQILPGHRVLLQLTINQDRPNNKFIQGVPTISTRQIVTSVLVQSGHTVVLGGIYETNAEDAKTAVPFLARIPLLGLLFQDDSNIKRRRELLIVVTPKIIANNL